MKVTVTSDLHGILPEIEPTDLLIICGDISPLKIQRDILSVNSWLNTDFKDWVKALPCDKVIMTPGNHDYFATMLHMDVKRQGFMNIFDNKLICLLNQYVEYNGLKIFGTPYCHMFGNWPFMCESDELEERFKKIPPFLDILITHDPVYKLGNSDAIMNPIYQGQEKGEHVGNIQLRNRLEFLYKEHKGLPKITVAGHIHSGDHTLSEWNGMKFANTSLVDESYEEAYRPLVLEI
jgi:Icc-related predicted phosphoesterase